MDKKKRAEPDLHSKRNFKHAYNIKHTQQKNEMKRHARGANLLKKLR